MFPLHIFLITTSFIIPKEIICTNVGSTLFYSRNIRSSCWSELDLAKLRARKVFERLSFKPPLPESINAKYIRNVLRYFKRTLRWVELGNDPQTVEILKHSLADMIGGHLRYEILPSTRFAYYAGYISLKEARSLHDFYDNTKKYLNTQGLGWKEPPKVPQLTNLSVAKLLVGRSTLVNSCRKLIYRRDANSCFHLPKPRVDDEKDPSAISLPFRHGGFVGLRTPKSQNIVVKYYTTAAKCILRNSPQKCRHGDFVAFNNDLWHWMKRDVAPHLGKEKLYAAYGGILQVAAAVQRYGQSLTRHNLFETNHSQNTSFWKPWKSLSSQMYVNCDWSPLIYALLVLITAIGICLLQICHNYVFRKSKCSCIGVADKDAIHHPIDVAYTSIDSNIPLILPPHPHSAIYVSNEMRTRRYIPKTKRASLDSFQKQKIYDLNENREKMMMVIMSDNEKREVTSIGTEVQENLTSSEDSSSNKSIKDKRVTPPKIIPEVSQLRLGKPKHRKVMPKFSSSGSSDSSASSISSRTRSRQPSSISDMRWARRVVSKHSTHEYDSKSTSPTETGATRSKT